MPIQDVPNFVSDCKVTPMIQEIN